MNVLVGFGSFFGGVKGAMGSAVLKAFRSFGYDIQDKARLDRWRVAHSKLRQVEKRMVALNMEVAHLQAERATLQEANKDLGRQTKALVKTVKASLPNAKEWREYLPVPIMVKSWGQFVFETSQAGAIARAAELTDGMDEASKLVVRAAIEDVYWAPWDPALRSATRFRMPHLKTRLPVDFNDLARVNPREVGLFTRKGPVNLGAVHQSLAFHHGLFEISELARLSIRGKDVIDAGAYVGDSAYAFCKHHPRSVHAFEPTLASYITLEDIALNGPYLGLIRPVKRILSDKGGEFAMSCDQESANAILQDQAAEGPQEIVESTTIDAYAAEQKLSVGLLKADVEGHEMQVLRGGLEVLKRDRPILLLSMYHTPADFFGLRQFVETELGDYEFRIRKYSPTPLMETILIATPKSLANPPVFNGALQ